MDEKPSLNLRISGGILHAAAPRDELTVCGIAVPLTQSADPIGNASTKWCSDCHQAYHDRDLVISR